VAKQGPTRPVRRLISSRQVRGSRRIGPPPRSSASSAPSFPNAAHVQRQHPSWPHGQPPPPPPWASRQPARSANTATSGRLFGRPWKQGPVFWPAGPGVRRPPRPRPPRRPPGGFGQRKYLTPPGRWTSPPGQHQRRRPPPPSEPRQRSPPPRSCPPARRAPVGPPRLGQRTARSSLSTQKN